MKAKEHLIQTLKEYPVEYDEQEGMIMIPKPTFKALCTIVRIHYGIRTKKRRILTKYVRRYIMEAIEEGLKDLEAENGRTATV